MDFLDVVFLPFQPSFYSIFLKNCGMVMTLSSPYVLGLWLGVSKGMLPVKYCGWG